MRNFTKKISMIMFAFIAAIAVSNMLPGNCDEVYAITKLEKSYGPTDDDSYYQMLIDLGASPDVAYEATYGSSQNSETITETPTVTNNVTSESAQVNNEVVNSSAPASTSVVKTAEATKPSTPTYTQEEIDAAWTESSRVDATCANAGSITYTNSITGETKSEEIPATSNHDYVESDCTEATCDVDGTVTYTCSVCGDSYTEIISASGHTADAPVVTKTAGLFSDGEETTSCSDCGTVLSTTVIPQRANATLVVIVAIAFLMAGVAGATFIIRKKKTK